MSHYSLKATIYLLYFYLLPLSLSLVLSSSLCIIVQNISFSIDANKWNVRNSTPKKILSFIQTHCINKSNSNKNFKYFREFLYPLQSILIYSSSTILAPKALNSDFLHEFCISAPLCQFFCTLFSFKSTIFTQRHLFALHVQTFNMLYAIMMKLSNIEFRFDKQKIIRVQRMSRRAAYSRRCTLARMRDGLKHRHKYCITTLMHALARNALDRRLNRASCPACGYLQETP